jgi:hypothetical protein
MFRLRREQVRAGAVPCLSERLKTRGGQPHSRHRMVAFPAMRRVVTTAESVVRALSKSGHVETSSLKK